MAFNPNTKRVEYISVDRQINQPPLDTSYVSIAQYVNTITSGGGFGDNKITSPKLAEMLEKDCSIALVLTKKVKSSNPSVKYEIADVETWANLGLFFAEKIKGGIALQMYRVTGNGEDKQNAVKHLENALGYWDKIIEITEPLYNDYPLVQYSEQEGKSWKENDHLRFHWRLLRQDVLNDIKIAEDAVSDNQTRDNK